jgi:hypothetical protein
MIKNHKQKQLKSILRKKLEPNIEQVLENIRVDVPIELVDFEEELEANTEQVLENIQVDLPIEHVDLITKVREFVVSATKVAQPIQLVVEFINLKNIVFYHLIYLIF